MTPLRLTTVKPDWIFIHDIDGEDIRCLVGSRRHEAAEKPGFVVVGVEERFAGGGERGLGEGVVLGTEVDFDVVAYFCYYVFGVEVETTETGYYCVGCAGGGFDL